MATLLPLLDVDGAFPIKILDKISACFEYPSDFKLSIKASQPFWSTTPPLFLILQSMEYGGNCKEGDLPYMKGHSSRVLIRGLCHSCGSGSPLTQRHIKKGAR
jgi:hypothetical protein